jgi:hypothetical protein
METGRYDSERITAVTFWEATTAVEGRAGPFPRWTGHGSQVGLNVKGSGDKRLSAEIGVFAFALRCICWTRPSMVVPAYQRHLPV